MFAHTPFACEAGTRFAPGSFSQLSALVGSGGELLERSSELLFIPRLD
jgi:hypothetical protein